MARMPTQLTYRVTPTVEYMLTLTWWRRLLLRAALGRKIAEIKCEMARID